LSIQFSDTSTYKGLVQMYEKEIGKEYGDISGSTVKLKSFTADANMAVDSFMDIALRADGSWNVDDTNHTDFPERKMTLTSGTRRYAISSFTADAGQNLPLDIFKVYVKNPDGIYVEIEPVDVQSDIGMQSFTDGQAVAGTPYRYDKTGNWLDLDPVPDYTLAEGIKILINREASYFASTDTTKKAGFPGLYHRYFYLHPAREYARIHGLASHDRIALEVAKLERDIEARFARRAKDGRGKDNVMTMRRIQHI